MITNNGKGIKISPNYFQKDWVDLNLTKNNPSDWASAILIFKDRIEGRYLKQIEALDLNKDRAVGLYAGFAIMSLTCLLMETLEQFWTGNTQTSRKSRTRQKEKKSLFKRLFKTKEIENISNDALAFYSFFQRSEKFKQFFDTKEKADIFYRKIRCGLLHQGQTKGKSLIHIRFGEPMLLWLDENSLEEGLSIHRRKFVKEVEEIYKSYVRELEKPGNLNFRRQTLEKKMRYIVELK